MNSFDNLPSAFKIPLSTFQMSPASTVIAIAMQAHEMTLRMNGGLKLSDRNPDSYRYQPEVTYGLSPKQDHMVNKRLNLSLAPPQNPFSAEQETTSVALTQSPTTQLRPTFDVGTSSFDSTFRGDLKVVNDLEVVI
jgi:hypothetical protein